MLFCRAAVLLLGASLCAGELPDSYRHVSRVTWIVKDAGRTAAGWEKLGLTSVHDDGRVTLRGEYRGKPVAIRIRHVSGELGDLGVDFFQPLGSEDAFADFLARHGDGIFSIVHEARSGEEISREAARMAGLGVRVLARVTVGAPGARMNFTYFDTEPQGKYVLGLVYAEGGPPRSKAAPKISHFGIVTREAEPVSEFWQKLGFPDLKISHATPREDGRYREKPLSLAFDVGYQRHAQFAYEWIIPPMTPRNIYADYLKLHGEGVQHMGVPVENLEKAVAEYRALGYGPWQAGAWGDVGKPKSGQYVYMDTDSIGGVSVELIHADR